jgi:hypothetical protein
MGWMPRRQILGSTVVALIGAGFPLGDLAVVADDRGQMH